MNSREQIKTVVREHYSQLAQSGRSCAENSCCSDIGTNSFEQLGYAREELERLGDEVLSVGAGCGSPTAYADLCEGEVVLDLGSGGGIDVFLAAQKVGPRGRAIGVDMTEAMVERARASAKKMNMANVEFLLGEIEALPLENASVDVVISNCVINLALDKDRVFREAFRVLKPGGRLIVSDIVTRGQMLDAVKKNLSAWAECLAGAMEDRQYLNTISEAGFKQVEVIAHSAMPEITGFYSATVQAYKL